MRITVIDGYPDRGSYGEALARAYVDGAKAGGHQVRLFRGRDPKFDAILHGGFKTPPPPCWWWHVPALLKGFIDRVFLPGVVSST